MKLSVELKTLPKGKGNSMLDHLIVQKYFSYYKIPNRISSDYMAIYVKHIYTYFLKFLKAAVSSSSPLISSGYGSPLTSVKGFISMKLKSRSMKNR